MLRKKDPDIHNREVVLFTLLGISTVLAVFVFGWLFFKYLQGQQYVLPRITVAGGVLILFVGLFALARAKFYRLAAVVLVILYLLVATTVVVAWGINIPSGILLYSLIIVMTGILLGARYSLYTAVGVGVLLIGLQILVDNKAIVAPDWTWAARPPQTSDLVSYCVLFGLLATISWLFNRQMERSLARARRAEAALQREKESLEIKVEERTRELQAAQFERMQQLYRFAELGQLSTALLHDLASHLTTLSLDIETIEEQNRSRMVQRAKRSIRYIDDMVKRVRDQLHGRTEARTFNIITEIDAVVQIARHKASLAHVQLEWRPPANRRSYRATGDPTRFRQLMANIIMNAIDAYHGMESGGQVVVAITASTKNMTIRVSDWGKGIPKEERAAVFEPFYSTKSNGMGLGLFIAKQIAHDSLGGSLRLDDHASHTMFVLTLPGAQE